MTLSTIREILVQSAEQFGQGDAVRYKAGKDQIETKSYVQLKQDSESFSLALMDLGEQGAHVAVTGMTSYPWLVTYLGTVNCGCVAVPLDVSLPAEEMCELISRADVTTVVLDEIRMGVGAILRQRCPEVKHLIMMKKEESDTEALSFTQLLAEHQGNCTYQPDPDSLCTIMFTSGTTGKSKGVMLTHRNMAENATCLDMKIPARTVILSVLPIHHAYCLSMDILKGLSLGSIICINDSLIRMAKNIQLFKPEMILMVPLMIETLAKKLEDAAALPPQLVKQQVFGEQFHTICSGGAYLTGRKKNLIITKNGENVSPEELENKLGEDRLVQEILVRENEGVIEAEIFPDLEYAAKKGIEDLQAALQERIDAYNRTAPAHKRVYRLKVRNTEFEKTPSKKIKRY